MIYISRDVSYKENYKLDSPYHTRCTPNIIFLALSPHNLYDMFKIKKREDGPYTGCPVHTEETHFSTISLFVQTKALFYVIFSDSINIASFMCLLSKRRWNIIVKVN